MSVTGYWAMAAIDPARLGEFAALATETERLAGSDDYRERRDAWAETWPSVDTLLPLAWLGSLDEHWLSGLPDDVVPDLAALFGLVGIRKGEPPGAFLHAFGPGLLDLFPGFLGNALLTPDEVRETLAAAADLRFGTTERELALQWVTEVGNGSPADLDELLDLVTRIPSVAAERGLALLSVTVAI